MSQRGLVAGDAAMATAPSLVGPTCLWKMRKVQRVIGFIGAAIKHRAEYAVCANMFCATFNLNFYIFQIKQLNSQMLVVQRAHVSVTREVSTTTSLLRRFGIDALLFLTITTGPE